MKKILYIISKQLDQDFNQFISSSVSPEYSISVILIQNGVRLNPTWAFPSFVLKDDIQLNEQSALYSKIQYSDMVHMIFEADTIISL